MTKAIIIALLKLSVLSVVTYFVYNDYSWVIALAAFTLILSAFYAIELLQLQLEKTTKIANFLDYQFGDGYIDEQNKFHKKGEPSVDLSKETYNE